MPSTPRGEQPAPDTSDIERDLKEIHKLKDDFDVELKASETSGTYDRVLKLKREISDRMAALKARAEALSAIKSETGDYQEPERADLKFAKELFGQDYFGPETLDGVWGIEIDPKDIPEIPFSQSQLEYDKMRSQLLILRARNGPDGLPLTMQKQHDLLNPDMESRGLGKVLAELDMPQMELMRKASFFNSDAPVMTKDQNYEWALTYPNVEVLSRPKPKNYLQQTDLLVTRAKQTFRGEMPRHYKDAVDEYQEYRRKTFGSLNEEQIERELASQDGRKHFQELARLKLNQLLLPTPAQMMFDMLTYYQDQNKRILEDAYTWTNTSYGDRYIVILGMFKEEGIKVDGHRVDFGGPSIGSIVSRTS
jgi:hypothetical protein